MLSGRFSQGFMKILPGEDQWLEDKDPLPCQYGSSLPATPDLQREVGIKMDVHTGTQDSLNISSSQNRTEGVQSKEMGQSLAPHHLPITSNASTRVRNRQTKIKPCGSCACVLPQHLLPPTAALQQGSSRLTWHKGSCRARLTPLLRILPIS